MVSFPYTLCGKVVKGFGRGSKELNVPTANLDENAVNCLPASLTNGIYYGFAQVDESPIYKMVMSVGYNPYYKNRKMTAEVHILHEFENDFYGSVLRVAVMGYIRPEKNFTNKEELIKEIQNDIKYASSKLNDPKYKEYLKDSDVFRNFKVNKSFDENENTELLCN